jgi:hypothetical protein
MSFYFLDKIFKIIKKINMAGQVGLQFRLDQESLDQNSIYFPCLIITQFFFSRISKFSVRSVTTTLRQQKLWGIT